MNVIKSGFKVLGVNSDSDVCERCGKTDLKKVVWLGRYEEGEQVEVVAYGADCAARALSQSRGRTKSAQVMREAVAADQEREATERNTVHMVGEFRSVVDWIIEAIDNPARPVTLTRANGLRSLVVPWAAERFPGRTVNVRKPIIPIPL